MTGKVQGKIRVLTFIESTKPVGPARSMIEIARAAAQPRLDLPSLEVTIGTYYRGTGNSPFAQTALDAGVPAFTIPERGRFDREAMWKMGELVDKVKPDILESQNVKSHLFIRILKLYQKYPWVVWNHGYTNTSRLDRIYTRVDRFSVRKAFRAVVVCGPFADKMHENGVARERITVMHSYAKPFLEPAPEEIEAVRRNLGIVGSAVVVVIGRLSREKGHADLFQAIPILSQMPGVPDFQVVVVGDGPERENLAALAAKLGIQNRIVMAGFQKDVRPFYRMAMVMALPSHSEGSPYVVLEAMMAALPVVATRVGGIPELIQDGINGLLIPSRDPGAMAEALQRLMMDSALRGQLGIAGNHYATGNHSFETYIENLIRFYKEIREKF